MTFVLRFLPEVEEDVLAGYEWYETKSPGLGEDFLRTFYAYAGELVRNPLLYPTVYTEFRRGLIKRFPYAVYFKIKQSQIIVFGLFHCARDPRSVRRYLRSRE